MIKLGKSMLKNSAGDTRKILETRYPDVSKKEIDQAIEKYYGKDTGVVKLQEDGDITGAGKKGESPKKA